MSTGERVCWVLTLVGAGMATAPFVAEEALAPMGTGRFAPSIGYLSQWYDYGLGGDDLSVMDFNVQTAFASV